MGLMRLNSRVETVEKISIEKETLDEHRQKLYAGMYGKQLTVSRAHLIGKVHPFVKVLRDEAHIQSRCLRLKNVGDLVEWRKVRSTAELVDSDNCDE